MPQLHFSTAVSAKNNVSQDRPRLSYTGYCAMMKQGVVFMLPWVGLMKSFSFWQQQTSTATTTSHQRRQQWKKTQRQQHQHQVIFYFLFCCSRIMCWGRKGGNEWCASVWTSHFYFVCFHWRMRDGGHFLPALHGLLHVRSELKLVAAHSVNKYYYWTTPGTTNFTHFVYGANTLLFRTGYLVRTNKQKNGVVLLVQNCLREYCQVEQWCA